MTSKFSNLLFKVEEVYGWLVCVYALTMDRLVVNTGQSMDADGEGRSNCTCVCLDEELRLKFVNMLNLLNIGRILIFKLIYLSPLPPVQIALVNSYDTGWGF